jgi:hypothetical protein
MEDIVKSIKAFLYERSVSPLFGAFIISWALWNYRFFLIISSGLRYQEKISAIEAHFAAASWGLLPGQVTFGFIVPSALALSYIFIYPHLAAPVYRYALRKQRELRSIKIAEENERVLTKEESRELLIRLTQLQERYESELEFAEAKIDSLRNELKNPKIAEQGGETVNGIYSDFSLDLESISEKLSRVQPDTPFYLSSLFEGDFWKSLNEEQRVQLNKNFEDYVARGSLRGVSFSARGGNGEFIYTRKELPPRKAVHLSEQEVKALISLTGTPSLFERGASTLAKHLGVHLERAKILLEELATKGYVRPDQIVAGEQAYELTSSARRYLIENGHA